MVVGYVWPDCDQIGKNQLDVPEDAFWLECAPAELEHIRPYISSAADPAVYPAVPCWWRAGEPLMCFFLVAKSLRWVWPQTREVLNSSQWYQNPFRELPESVAIHHLKDLAMIAIPDALRI